jgi:hypothetical protein
VSKKRTIGAPLAFFRVKMLAFLSIAYRYIGATQVATRTSRKTGKRSTMSHSKSKTTGRKAKSTAHRSRSTKESMPETSQQESMCEDASAI